MPPVNRTRVWPSATRPTKEACRATTLILYCDRNAGAAKESKITSARSATSTPLASHLRNRASQFQAPARIGCNVVTVFIDTSRSTHRQGEQAFLRGAGGGHDA